MVTIGSDDVILLGGRWNKKDKAQKKKKKKKVNTNPHNNPIHYTRNIPASKKTPKPNPNM